MHITLRILDGADRGRVFDTLPTPVTIGREEGNTIQLNDERVSRYHAKIQADREKVILTDLDSTNGTKVNGDESRLRILRFGDVINIGRSLLLYGSEDQIAHRLAALRGAGDEADATKAPGDKKNGKEEISLNFELAWPADPQARSVLHSLQFPDLPERLSPGQAAQLSELLEYLHLRIRDLIASIHIDDDEERVTLEMRQWQNLLDLQARLSRYLRKISEPHEDSEEPE